MPVVEVSLSGSVAGEAEAVVFKSNRYSGFLLAVKVICKTTNILNVFTKLNIIIFITSRIPDEILKTDIVIDFKRDDFSTTGLLVSSAIR